MAAQVRAEEAPEAAAAREVLGKAALGRVDRAKVDQAQADQAKVGVDRAAARQVAVQMRVQTATAGKPVTIRPARAIAGQGEVPIHPGRRRMLLMLEP
jgi:hypothetical protein